MDMITPMLVHVLPLMLVTARLTGIFLFTPLLRSSTLPRVFKAMLAFMFAIALYPAVPQFSPAAAIDTVQLVPLLFSELLVGISIGLIAAMPLYAMQMGGFVMGYQVGLSLAESFNPELDSNGSVLGLLLFYMAVFIFIGLGGFELLFLALADSFHTAPIGMFTAQDVPLEMFVEVITSGFELAIRVASPVIAAVAMSQVAMGLVMKTMPQVNIMSIGFAIQILTGLILLMLMINVMGTVAGEEIDRVMDGLSLWIQDLATDSAHARALQSAEGGN
ncbi:MAG: flagellar biosynthetic protein FliR [Phycisphaerales bacterium]|nr:flagellar biosynthetic protein FliR [Phycisphaerales bacterium]